MYNHQSNIKDKALVGLNFDEQWLSQMIQWEHINSEEQSDQQDQNSSEKQIVTKQDDLIKLTQVKNAQIQIEAMLEDSYVEKKIICGLNQQELPHLFQKHLFVENHQQRKNPNFTKFIVSGFNKQLKKLNSDNLIQKQHYSFCEKSKRRYQSNGRRNIQMQALNILFGDDKQSEQYTKQNRILLYNLLGRSNFKKYVVSNPFAQDHNKKQHLLASKVYRLRCLSKNLTGRTQTK